MIKWKEVDYFCEKCHKSVPNEEIYVIKRFRSDQYDEIIAYICYECAEKLVGKYIRKR